MMMMMMMMIKAWQPDTFCVDFPKFGLVNMVTRYDLQDLLIM